MRRAASGPGAVERTVFNVGVDHAGPDLDAKERTGLHDSEGRRCRYLSGSIKNPPTGS